MKKVLVVRNDKLGDFTLALPAFALLRRELPDAKIVALVPTYTRDLAEWYPAIDEVVVDPGPGSAAGRSRALGKLLRAQRFDAALVLYSTHRIAAALALARIPYRLAPATKLAQLLYTKRLVQRRSESKKPEYEYNLDLAAQFLRDHGIVAQPELHRPVIDISPELARQRRQDLAGRLAVDPASRWLFVHPGDGGSANNLTLERYGRLIDALSPGDDCTVLVSAGPGEQTAAESLRERLNVNRSAVFVSDGGLIAYIETLASADLFISGSTGTLQLAGALDRNTVGFYPRRRSSTALRWQTLSRPDRRVAFMPQEPADERDMGSIDLVAAAAKIREAFPAVFEPA